jgi:glycosyltransferase involved in cell wall biosynthesis
LNIKEEKLIGHVGNFVYQKNHDYLIDVFVELLKINSESKLVLVGDGQLKADITKKIFSLGIEDNVIILGKVDNVQKYIQAMDVFVLPSRFEGLPLALIEAQASGVPCFISDNITEEVNISGFVEFISLEKEVFEWGKIIDNYDYSAIEREKAYLSVIAAGYDIRSNSKIICDLYTR